MTELDTPHSYCHERFETAEGVLRAFVDSEIVFGACACGGLVTEQQWTAEECIQVVEKITEGLTVITMVKDGVVGPDDAVPYVTKALRGIAHKINTEVAG